MPGAQDRRRHAKVSFESLCWDTVPGQLVAVVGSHPALGSWQASKGIKLSTTSETFPTWSGSVELPVDEVLEFKSIVLGPAGDVRWEGGKNRTCLLTADSAWRISSRFDGLQTTQEKVQIESVGYQLSTMVMVEFTAVCWKTSLGDILRIVGSLDALGSWQPHHGLELTTKENLFPKWTCQANVPIGMPMEFKMVICRGSGDVEWENSENRRVTPAHGRRILVHWCGPCFEEEDRVASKASTPAIADVALPKAAKVELSTSGSAAAETAMDGDESSPEAPTVGRERSSSTASTELPDSARRSASWSVLQAPGSAPAEPATAVAEAAAEEAAGQTLVLKLSGMPQEVAPYAGVVAVFENANGDRFTVPIDTATAEQAQWKLDTAEIGFAPGVYLFHFLVEGERILSRQHPVYHNFNAILIHESFRRYVLVRDAATIELAKEDEAIAQQHSVARPWSFAAGLSDLTGSPVSVAPVKVTIAPKFDAEIFAQLYCPELRLRLDGIAVPEPPAPELAASVPLRLWSGAYILKKGHGVCEDAFFTSDYGLGVADGVGSMIQLAKHGVNAAEYAADLMRCSCEYLAGQPMDTDVHPADLAMKAVEVAENGAEAFGAATIVTLAVRGTRVGVANLGDSGFMLLRKTPSGMAIVQTSPEQQHSWNCPYQLTKLPPMLMERFKAQLTAIDHARDAERYEVDARPGDLLLLFSDGMRDNLHENEVLHIVDCTLSPALAELAGLPGRATAPESVARALVMAAYERSLDETARVPFTEYSKRHGYECVGGKQDDITVVAAWVMADPREGEPQAVVAPEAVIMSASAAKDAAEAASGSAAEPMQATSSGEAAMQGTSSGEAGSKKPRRRRNRRRQQ